MTLFSSLPINGLTHKVDTIAGQINADVAAQHPTTHLLEISMKVRAESMQVTTEFDAIEDFTTKLITDAST